MMTPSSTSLWLCAIVVVLCVHGGVSTNWAIPTGPKLSNAALIAETRWLPRWGAATSVVLNPPASDEVVQTESEKSRIFFMGGDDHAINKGGGQLYNDVWTTTGSNWAIVENHVKLTLWDEPTPSISSQMRWNPVAANMIPQDGQTYREWLCCATDDWACETKVCEGKTDTASMRWSPRRSFGAATLDKDVFVMGGRARSLEDIRPEEAIGSIIGERNRWREISLLMSDVWSTKDGVNWNLVNSGCYVQEKSLLYKGAGLPYGQCRTFRDCRAQKLGDTECWRGNCVCRHWGPRERFGVVANDGFLFVVGGVTHVQRQLCGKYSCGEQYRHVLNDVWRSVDGQQWAVMTLNGRFPPRSDFGLAVGGGLMFIAGGRGATPRVFGNNTLYNDVWTSSTHGVSWQLNTSQAEWEPRCMHSMEYNEHKLVIWGGMTRLPDPPASAELTPFQKVVQASVNAPTERTGGGSGEGTDGADGADFELINGVRMVLSEEVWSWKLTGDWILDFDNHTAEMWYLRPESPLWGLRFIDEFERAALEEHGITTVGELADADLDTVTNAKEDVEDFCQYWMNARKILDFCRVKEITYDGQFFASLETVGGDAAAEDYRTEQEELDVVQATDDEALASYEDETGCSVELLQGLTWNEDDVDVVCRWSPTARRNMPSAVLNKQVYSFGGYLGRDTFGHDVWIRDDHKPMTEITVQPATESSETVFDFACDEPGCLFEYRFVNIDDPDEPEFVERNWTLAIPPIDFLEWAPGAIYRFEVRAIDPAGNKDPEYEIGRNALVWEYIPALPVFLITMLVLLFIALSTGAYLEWRRRRKKKAMERYAIKRMRRKFKGIAKDAKGADVDWRQYYEESKTGAKGKELAKQMAAELEKKGKGGKKAKSKKDKKGRKGKGRGKSKDGKGKKGKKKGKGKDKKKKGKGKDKKKKGKTKNTKKKGKDKKKKGKGKDKKKKGKGKKKGRK